MSNILTYAAELKDLTFEEVAFGTVDCLIFSQLSYMSFDNFVFGYQDGQPSRPISDLMKHPDKEFLYHGILMGKETEQLVEVIGNSKRYGHIKMNFYENYFDEQSVEQFSAITFMISDNFSLVAYRGTDDSFVGWKEDFDMTFLTPIPAQVRAMKYLNAVGNLTNGKIIVSGHSKGGNLAVFALMNANADVQNKIVKVYNHDGPGFTQEVIDSPLYLKVKDRIQTILPHSSVVGMLMHQSDEFLVVESTRFWVMQHDPFSWVVNGRDFAYKEGLSEGSRLFSKSLNEWLNSIPHEKRMTFVDTMFNLLDATGTKDVTHLTADMIKSAYTILNALNDIDPEVRHFCYETLISLFVCTANNMKDENLEKIAHKLHLEHKHLHMPKFEIPNVISETFETVKEKIEKK